MSINFKKLSYEVPLNFEFKGEYNVMHSPLFIKKLTHSSPPAFPLGYLGGITHSNT